MHDVDRWEWLHQVMGLEVLPRQKRLKRQLDRMLVWQLVTIGLVAIEGVVLALVVLWLKDPWSGG